MSCSLCSDSCHGVCSGCGNCSGSCSGSCSDSCGTGCGSGCSGGCSMSCTGGCQESCQHTCDGDCEGYCDGSCSGGCYSTCSTTCKATCAMTCDLSCNNTCMNACTGENNSTLANNLWANWGVLITAGDNTNNFNGLIQLITKDIDYYNANHTSKISGKAMKTVVSGNLVKLSEGTDKILEPMYDNLIAMGQTLTSPTTLTDKPITKAYIKTYVDAALKVFFSVYK